MLIALFHDILITAGVYALADREVTTSTVAALLTILGYSLYDTIIVFDRIRENVPRMPRAAFTQIVNRSMAEVLTRSLATSLCTLLPGHRADAVRRRDAARLRVRAARRDRLGRLLVDLHRIAGARRVEGARAGLPPPPQDGHGGARRRRARRSRPARSPTRSPRPPHRPRPRAGGRRDAAAPRRRAAAGPQLPRRRRSRPRSRRRSRRRSPSRSLRAAAEPPTAARATRRPTAHDGDGDRPPPRPKPKRQRPRKKHGRR